MKVRMLLFLAEWIHLATVPTAMMTDVMCFHVVLDAVRPLAVLLTLGVVATILGQLLFLLLVEMFLVLEFARLEPAMLSILVESIYLLASCLWEPMLMKMSLLLESLVLAFLMGGVAKKESLLGCPLRRAAWSALPASVSQTSPQSPPCWTRSFQR
ncbi:unnamed protein product [Prorocentrum cordatum]|uniref:Uncharacterized protein n=1 Tax=Prorocentrum cordatum TaxID=2364126 RepID=A0ABN9WMB0_9DINO|nr:unnamed protein product [Polarella glacialis]